MLDSVRPAPFCSTLSLRGKEWAHPVEAAFEVPPDVHPDAARVAANRGVTDLAGYFSPSFRSAMPDPSDLRQMDAAARRMADAVHAGERIGVIGDYDVDGATSVSIALLFLRRMRHAAVTWRIPHRIDDGYGANPRLVEAMSREDGVTLLLILDSGTTSFEAIDAARALGMDVIVLDHHEPAPQGLPDAIVVNPKRPDEDRSLDYLCTAGLAFLFAVAVLRELRLEGRLAGRGLPETDLDLRDLLGLVALGTVADVVPLVGLNRAYAAIGFRRMHRNVGITALSEVTGHPRFDAHTCGFVFGPCLNAAGRIEDMAMSVELLTTTDSRRALALAERLHELNGVRRRITLEAIEQAKAAVSSDPANRRGVIVVHDEGWHPGVVGLVAAKVREFFDRPCVAIGTGGKGSCRSVEGYHIGAAVIAATAVGILVKGGGHGAAAGLTVDAARVPDLKRHLDESFGDHVAPPVTADIVMSCGEPTPALVHALETLSPFGMGNARPRIAVVGGVVRKAQVIKDVHVKAWLAGPGGETQVMAFNGVDTPVGDALRRSTGRRVDVIGTMTVSEFGGVSSVTVKPEDVMVGPGG